MQAKVIKETLVDLIPGNSSLYEENYKQFVEDLIAVNNALHRELAPLAGTALVVNHASMGYFCHEYELKQLALETDGKALLPGQLRDIQDVVTEYDIKCIYVMPQFENKGAYEIANQLKLTVASINPLSKDYLSNLRSIGTTISTCKSNETDN